MYLQINLGAREKTLMPSWDPYFLQGYFLYIATVVFFNTANQIHTKQKQKTNKKGLKGEKHLQSKNHAKD